jgi:hypothetical protein
MAGRNRIAAPVSATKACEGTSLLVGRNLHEGEQDEN